MAEELAPLLLQGGGLALWVTVTVLLWRTAHRLQSSNVRDLHNLVAHHRQRAETADRRLDRLRGRCTCGAIENGDS